MRPETQQGNRRRRGGRRHRGPRSGSTSSTSSPRGTSSGSGRRSGSSEKAPEKLGFFQRIIAFFTGKKPASRPVPGNVYGRVITDTPAPSSRSNGQSSRPAPKPAAAESRPVESPEAAAPKPTRPARKPELVEVTSPKLYVGNLSFDASESDLSELFSGVGQVQSSEVVCHRETQRSKGFAFITMCTVEEARRAVDELHDKEYLGRRLVVSGAKTSDVR